MYCLPHKIVTSFTNFHTTAIVGMWAVLPKDCETESNNMFRNLSIEAILSNNVLSQFANANIPPSQQPKRNFLPTSRPLDLNSYAILFRPNTTVIACSPFHLSAVAATFFKISNPILCRQKEFVYNLKIPHVSAVFKFATYSFAATLIGYSANHSPSTSINTRPFLCSPF